MKFFKINKHNGRGKKVKSLPCSVFSITKLLKGLPGSDFRTRKTTTGFTLIELLVVISIIGFLSSVVLASLQTAREKAQASKFRQEMNQVVTALELYKNSNDGKYPYEDSVPSGGTGDYTYVRYSNNTEASTYGGPLLTSLLVPTYLGKMPEIPNPNTSTSIVYIIKTNGSNTSTHSRCAGEIKASPYNILISKTNNALLSDVFKDWPTQEYSNPPYTTWSEGAYLCFSIK
jgi:prepilin-type N-terminal cleavage/methylation domain-containing protein